MESKKKSKGCYGLVKPGVDAAGEVTQDASVIKDPRRFVFTIKLRSKAAAAMEAHAMINVGDKVLIGVSGGCDSTALLHFLLEIQEESGIHIGVAHVNHCLRPDESDRDEAFVKDLASDLNLPFHSTCQDVKTLAVLHKRSMEDEARQVRYRFYTSLMQEYGYTKTALGHTLDDNIEQVLMGMIRGSGPLGLSGIPPVRDGWIVRPLIQVPKEAVLGYLSENGYTHVTDSTNQDVSILRNRVRNRLLPLLKSEYNPGIGNALERLSSILREEDHWMEAEIDQFFKGSATTLSECEVCFLPEAVRSLHKAFQRRVFRRAIRHVKGDLKRISLAHIDAAVDLACSPRGNTSLDLPGRIQVKRCRGGICFVRQTMPLRELGRLKKLERAQKKSGKEFLA